MARRRRRSSPRPIPPLPRAVERGHPAPPARGSIAPTIVWGVAASFTTALLVIVALLPFSQPHLPGTRWRFAGMILILAVITLALALKALQAFLNWKDPD
ncbi:MAG TPA: hypothetical protein VFC51_18810 [Chloroflexota bacterium]|nr:hypothetical protein [Chloroflexota bacterium]